MRNNINGKFTVLPIIKILCTCARDKKLRLITNKKFR